MLRSIRRVRGVARPSRMFSRPARRPTGPRTLHLAAAPSPRAGDAVAPSGILRGRGRVRLLVVDVRTPPTIHAAPRCTWPPLHVAAAASPRDAVAPSGIVRGRGRVRLAVDVRSPPTIEVAPAAVPRHVPGLSTWHPAVVPRRVLGPSTWHPAAVLRLSLGEFYSLHLSARRAHAGHVGHSSSSSVTGVGLSFFAGGGGCLSDVLGRGTQPNFHVMGTNQIST